MTTKTLQLTPVQQGQSARMPDGVIYTQLEGGAGRYRADLENSARFVTLRFVLTGEQYQYLQAFLRTTRGAAFFMPLYTDNSNAATHTVRVIPNTLSVQAPRGGAYIVEFEVEAEQVAAIADFDAAIIFLFELYDSPTEPAAIVNLFDELANVSLPTVGSTS
jgi:hypothetical protein